MDMKKLELETDSYKEVFERACEFAKKISKREDFSFFEFDERLYFGSLEIKKIFQNKSLLFDILSDEQFLDKSSLIIKVNAGNFFLKQVNFEENGACRPFWDSLSTYDCLIGGDDVGPQWEEECKIICSVVKANKLLYSK